MIKPKQAVIEMQAYNPPTSNREGSLRLDFNENTIGCSPKVIKSLKMMKRETFSMYPEYTKLRNDLARYCKVKSNQIIATNGTDEAIKIIIETYLEKRKNEIILPVPTYAMFKFYAQLNEAVIKEITYKEDLSFPTQHVLGAINKKTKIIVLVNPNNPTGTSISKIDIIKIIEKAIRYGSLVLMDETYLQFSGQTSISLIKRYDNLFITQTFSKAFGLAGLRLGYLISKKVNIGIVQKVLSPYSVNTVAAVCASTALMDTCYMKKYVTETRKSKEILYKKLKDLGIKCYKSDTNFVLVDIGAKANQFCKKLRKKGILVRNRSSDTLLNGCVRITLGTIGQTKLLIRELQKIVKDINPLLVFDIDGVLVDVSKSYIYAIKKTVEYFTGTRIYSDEIQTYRNRGGLNSDWSLTQSIIQEKKIRVSKKIVIDKFQQYYTSVMNNERWLLDRKILRSLAKKYSLAILTGRPKREAFYVLRKNRVIAYFKEIVAMEDSAKQKPYPDGLLKILNKYVNSDAYYFGDSIDDMKAAISAELVPIGILPPENKSPSLRNILLKNGAKVVLTDINEIEMAL